jgi:hypothetical protein
MALLALALMTAAVLAAYSSTSAEIVATNAVRAQDHAYQLAEAGLQQFLVRRGEASFCPSCTTDPTVRDSEYTTVPLVGGYARVVATRVRPKLTDGTPALFFVRSTGIDTSVKLSGAGKGVYATRTLGQYATFGTPTVKPLSAWTSLSGITNAANGSLAPINGNDACGKAAALAGAVVPRGGQYRGSGKLPIGTPPVDSSMTLDSLKKRVGVDWNAIVNYNAIPADYTIPGTFPPKTAFNDSSFWPVIRIRTNYTIPYDGRGLIIADSGLAFTSNSVWDGIVLVGGVLVSTGNDTTFGVVVSGLNRILPNAVNPADGNWIDNDYVGNTKRFVYNSCKAARAVERLAVYFAWPNTWLDDVPVW